MQLNKSSITHSYTAGDYELTFKLISPYPGMEVSFSESANWITKVKVGNQKLSYSVSANSATSKREATITLNYNGKNYNVKVTQNGKPEDKPETVTQPNNEIWYTSSDGKVVNPRKEGEDIFGAEIESNTYKNGKGIIKFKGNVTTIGKEAFGYCKSLTSVTIPNSVTTIGDSAFRVCPNLTTINIPNRVTTIGKYAFEECCSIKSITIPNSVKAIGGCAFNRCSNLTSVTISNSITAIHEFTFNECSNLKSVAIPEGVKHIDDFAFKGCDMLESVTLPYSIIEIGWDAFFGCRNLRTVYCHATIPPSISESSFASSKYKNYFDNIVYEYNCTIYVPSYAVDNYKKQFGGKMNKKNIIGVSFN